MANPFQRLGTSIVTLWAAYKALLRLHGLVPPESMRQPVVDEPVEILPEPTAPAPVVLDAASQESPVARRRKKGKAPAPVQASAATSDPVLSETGTAPDVANLAVAVQSPLSPSQVLELRQTSLDQLLAQHRVLRNGPGDIQINSEERDGERQARINTNRERQLQVELAMLDVIRNNAAIAQQRRLIIEDSIRENANRVSALTEERERIRQENQEKAEERMAEIKGQILAISGVLDDLEDERKIIRRALAPQLNREAMEKAIEDRKQRAGENEAKHERRAERIREAREIRIQQRAQRLARMMAKRTAEIESEKEARIAANAGR